MSHEIVVLQIDVDIGSSAVARSVIGLVLGYVTSLIVDLAILIEVSLLLDFILKGKCFFASELNIFLQLPNEMQGKEETELPEYILGTVRLNRIELDSAISFEV